MSVTAHANSPDPDLPLVCQALAGDFAAFEQLVNRYEKRVYGLALRIVRNDADAQDVTQSTLLALLEKLETFSQESHFAAWLLRIATNESLLLLRKRKVRQMQSLEPADGGPEPLPHPDLIAKWKLDPQELASRAEIRELIDAALDEVPEKYRLVFLLRDVQGLSTEEAAEALGISLSNAKVRLLRARLMLRERLTKALGDPDTFMRHSH